MCVFFFFKEYSTLQTVPTLTFSGLYIALHTPSNPQMYLASHPDKPVFGPMSLLSLRSLPCSSLGCLCLGCCGPGIPLPFDFDTPSHFEAEI